MSERQKKAEWVIAALVVLAVCLAPVLYLLSIGPAVMLSDRGYLSDRTGEIVYGPVVWGAERFPWFAAGLEWYVGVWR
jgi:hypothetical protein